MIYTVTQFLMNLKFNSTHPTQRFVLGLIETNYLPNAEITNP
jgi:hypothetical protein